MRVIGTGSESVIIHHNGDNVEVWYNYEQDPYQIARDWVDRPEPISAWGQKTVKSSLDRVSVRRLLASIEQAMNNTLGSYVGGFNDEVTRNDAAAIMNQDIAEMAARGAVLNNWKVVCDETNNGPNVIDNNRLQMDIIVQPSKTVEYITLRGVLSTEGASFTTENKKL